MLHKVYKGEEHGKAELTEDWVREIRARYSEGNISQKALGADYLVSQQTICDIVNRKLWRHI